MSVYPEEEEGGGEMKAILLLFTLVVQFTIAGGFIYRYYALQEKGVEIFLDVETDLLYELSKERNAFNLFERVTYITYKGQEHRGWSYCEDDVIQDNWAYLPIIPGDPLSSLGKISREKPKDLHSIKVFVLTGGGRPMRQDGQRSMARIGVFYLNLYTIIDRLKVDINEIIGESREDPRIVLVKRYLEVYGPKEGVPSQTSMVVNLADQYLFGSDYTPQASARLKIYDHQAIITGLYLDGRPIEEVVKAMKKGMRTLP